MPNRETGTPVTPGNDNARPAPNPVMKLLLIVIAVPLVLIKNGLDLLMRPTYGDHRHLYILRRLFGIVSGVAAGIGTGYYCGWVLNYSLSGWLTAGLSTAVATFVVGFPFVYLLGLRQLARLSDWLWQMADEDLQNRDVGEVFYGGFTVVSIIAAVIFGCVQGNVVFHKLVGEYGNWAYVGAVIGGGLVSLISGSVLIGFLNLSGSVAVAFGTGAALSWFGTPAIESYIQSHYGYAGPSVFWGIFVAQLILWCTYGFPLVVVLFSRGLARLFDFLGKMLEKAYDDQVGVYDKVFGQIAAIAVTVGAVLALPLGLAYAGLTLSAVTVCVLQAVAGFAVYLYIGLLFKEAGNASVSLVGSAALGVYAGFGYSQADYWFGVWGAGIFGFAVALVHFICVYPVAYVILRAIAAPVLNNSAAELILKLHGFVEEKVHQFFSELLRAHRNTYYDTSAYSRLFLQVINLALLPAVYFGLTAALAATGLSLVVQYCLLGLSLGLSYLLGVKIITRFGGNYFVGAIVGLAAAIASGTLCYAQHFTGVTIGERIFTDFWLAVPAGFAFGLLTFLWLFPLAYVLVKFPLNPLLSFWLEPVLSGIHDFCWRRFTNIWVQFVDTYNKVNTWFEPIWASIRVTWEDAKRTVNDMFRSRRQD